MQGAGPKVVEITARFMKSHRPKDPTYIPEAWAGATPVWALRRAQTCSLAIAARRSLPPTQFRF